MSLATLSIDIVARLASLQDGLDKAGRLSAKRAADIENQWKRIGAAATAVGAALAGAFAGVSFVGFIRSQADAVDAMNDVRDATGASIENISALDDIARRTGATLEGDVAPALVKFNQLLKDADGKNSSSLILKEIGLNAEELRRMDPAEALLEVSKALATYESDGNKARVMQELFGKSAAQLAPFLNDLAEAGKLVGSVTTEQAQAAEEFNKKLAALDTELNVVGRSIANGVIPELSALLNAMTDGAKGAGDYSTAVATIVEPLQWAVRAASGAAFAIERYGRAWGALVASGAQFAQGNLAGARSIVEEFRIESEQALATFSDFQRSVAAGAGGGSTSLTAGDFARMDRANGGTRRLGNVPAAVRDPRRSRTDVVVFGPELPKELEAAQQAIEATDLNKVAELRAQLQGLLAIRSGASDTTAVDAAIAEVTLKIEELNPAAKTAEERLARFYELLDATPSKELEKAREDMQILAEKFNEGRINAEQFNEAATARLGLIGDSMDKVNKELDEFTKSAAQNIQGALADSMYDALTGDFDNIGEQFGQLLLRMVAEAQAANLAKALFGNLVEGGSGNGLLGQFLGSIGAQLVGGGGASIPSTSSASLTTGDFARLDRSYAEGTDRVPEDGVYLLHKDERVVPAKFNPAIGNGGRGGNQYVTVENRSGGEVREERTQGPSGDSFVRIIIEQAKAAVAADFASGGQVARSASSAFGLRRNTPRVGR